jgi:hypothetical protein
MPWREPEYPGEFPTLGWLVGEWIETHCVIPDREHGGEPYKLTDEMWVFLAHHYRLRLDARGGPAVDRRSPTAVRSWSVRRSGARDR